MSLTIESLSKQAIELQKQVEAASNMMHQSAGALALVRTQIAQLQKEQQEQAAKEAQENEQADNEAAE